MTGELVPRPDALDLLLPAGVQPHLACDCELVWPRSSGAPRVFIRFRIPDRGPWEHAFYLSSPHVLAKPRWVFVARRSGVPVAAIDTEGVPILAPLDLSVATTSHRADDPFAIARLTFVIGEATAAGGRLVVTAPRAFELLREGSAPQDVVADPAPSAPNVAVRGSDPNTRSRKQRKSPSLGRDTRGSFGCHPSIGKSKVFWASPRC